jgi:hypothetical protein
MKRLGDLWRFQVRANGHLFQIFCHNSELTPEKIAEINAQFKNSLRYLKHYAGFFDETASEKDIKKAMTKLSGTTNGIAIRIEDDLVTEFTPFQ